MTQTFPFVGKMKRYGEKGWCCIKPQPERRFNCVVQERFGRSTLSAHMVLLSEWKCSVVKDMLVIARAFIIYCSWMSLQASWTLSLVNIWFFCSTPRVDTNALLLCNSGSGLPVCTCSEKFVVHRVEGVWATAQWGEAVLAQVVSGTAWQTEGTVQTWAFRSYFRTSQALFSVFIIDFLPVLSPNKSYLMKCNRECVLFNV